MFYTIILKFEKYVFNHTVMCPKEGMANSVDPDQTAPSANSVDPDQTAPSANSVDPDQTAPLANSVDPDQAASSDLGLHCLTRPVCPNTSDHVHIQVVIVKIDVFIVIQRSQKHPETTKPSSYSRCHLSRLLTKPTK